MCVYESMYMCACVSMHVSIYACTCMSACMCVCVHEYTSALIYMWNSFQKFFFCLLLLQNSSKPVVNLCILLNLHHSFDLLVNGLYDLISTLNETTQARVCR